jgi:hypothetical protein
LKKLAALQTGRRIVVCRIHGPESLSCEAGECQVLGRCRSEKDD